ncbi:ATP-binding protein [Desulfotomaculum copahuensis]
MARLDRLNLVGEMAAALGHEVRNPITTVRGFLQLLEDKKELSSFREYFDLMIDELDRASAIITEFLSLAKNKTIELKEENLNHILTAMLPLLQSDSAKMDKSVHLELSDIPALLLDEKEIRQVILNLVRNGLEAMPPGGRLTIKTYREDTEAVLAVQDQGNGLPPGVLERIGTPFFTTKENGTGMGLAVCYSIAARHKAKIDIETGPAGTTFLVKFTLH